MSLCLTLNTHFAKKTLIGSFCLALTRIRIPRHQSDVSFIFSDVSFTSALRITTEAEMLVDNSDNDILCIWEQNFLLCSEIERKGTMEIQGQVILIIDLGIIIS